MDIFLTVIEIVAPAFLLAAIGFSWVKLGYEYRVEFVTRLAMTLAIPCLIFVALMQSEIDPSALGALSLAGLLTYLMVIITMTVLIRITGLNKQTFLAPMIFSNTGNLGLPLALFAFGDNGLGYAVVIFAVSGVLQFTYGIWIVSGGGSLRRVVQEPLVSATLLGALFLWQGWETPQFLTNALDLIGQMGIPLMLITLGVAVARLEINALFFPAVLSVFKSSICISCALAVGIWFELEPVALGVLILQLATPVAVTSYMLAEKYGADSESVAGLVVVSTLISIISIPVVLSFLV